MLVKGSRKKKKSSSTSGRATKRGGGKGRATKEKRNFDYLSVYLKLRRSHHPPSLSCPFSQPP